MTLSYFWWKKNLVLEPKTGFPAFWQVLCIYKWVCDWWNISLVYWWLLAYNSFKFRTTKFFVIIKMDISPVWLCCLTQCCFFVCENVDISSSVGTRNKKIIYRCCEVAVEKGCCQKWDSNPRLQRRLRPERSALDRSAILTVTTWFLHANIAITGIPNIHLLVIFNYIYSSLASSTLYCPMWNTVFLAKQDILKHFL